MSLDKQIFDAINEGPEAKFDLASEVSAFIRDLTEPDQIWYCRKYKTTIAVPLGKSRCVARVSNKNREHLSSRNGCGLFWLVKDQPRKNPPK